MINFSELQRTEVAEDIVTFMKSNGGNHIALYKGFNEHPRIGDHPKALLHCLAYAIQNHRSSLVAKRILGRYRCVVRDMENANLEVRFDEDPEAGCLD